MKTRVICVSRTTAAFGDEVARGLSRRLGFRYVDEEIVAMAAEREGVDVEVVQNAERRQTFLQRLIESLVVAPAPDLMAPGPVFSAAMGPHSDPVAAAAFRGTEHFRQLIRDVIRDTAREGNVVIVAHASALALAGEPGVLRVSVTASPRTRASRLSLEQGIDGSKAERLIAQSDDNRREYLKAFYGVEEELSLHYDLVANTDVLSVAQVVEAVVAVAQA